MRKEIAVLAGDGIGPEVMREALKVLRKIGDEFGHEFKFKEALAGGAAWDDYQNHLPEETLGICRESDAILFGSVGEEASMQDDPKWRDAEKNAILGLRKEFGLNINLRPAKVYPQLKDFCPLKFELIKDGVDILVVRELTGGIYFGEPRETVETDGGKKAVDTMVYSTLEIERIAHTAFKAAQKRRGKLTSVDKANVLDCSRLWREVVDKVSEQYGDVELEHLLVDTVAMRLITHPARFDVIVTSNMFGDILSDESAAFPGSLGLMPSASIGEKINMYEPSGGSAPDIAGKGIANPIAQILSGAMMLKYSFDMMREHDAIVNAVDRVLDEGFRTADIAEKKEKMIPTSEMGDAIAKFIIVK